MSELALSAHPRSSCTENETSHTWLAFNSEEIDVLPKGAMLKPIQFAWKCERFALSSFESRCEKAMEKARNYGGIQNEFAWLGWHRIDDLTA